MLDRIDSELSFSQKALDIRAYRQELLASNIANADTPHYKARDLDFKATLGKALSGRLDGSLALAQTSSRHMAGGESAPYAGAVKYRTEYQSAVDGNTVDMDVERGAFAENALHMEALMKFVGEKFKTMQSALSNQ